MNTTRKTSANKYVFTALILLILVIIAAFGTYFGWGSEIFAGQSKKEREPAAQTDDRPVMPPVNAPAETRPLTLPPEAFMDLTGKGINPLSGLYIDEAAITRRPFAVVFNNNSVSLPQSGISQADIIYEVISEGDITRLIGIFQDFDAGKRGMTQKMGSIRSARHYFIDIALDYDAFFVHFGGSPQAYKAIADLKINNINGIYLDSGVRTENFNSVVFWRDKTRWGASKMREHSAYTNAENLIRQAEKAGYRLWKNDLESTPFSFYDKPSSPSEAAPANRISVSYVSSNPGVFEYDEETRKYSRFQNKGPSVHLDEETGEQITVDNLIVQLTSVNAIKGDSEGRRDVAVIGSGNGFLFTNGTMTPIRWSKSGHNSPTVWTFVNGEKLTLNKGQTWISITNKEPVAE